MKLKFLLVFLLLAMLLPTTASAYDAEINGICYNFSGNEATVTYKDFWNPTYSGQINIPARVYSNGAYYNVTAIGEYAFRSATEVTGVTIGSNVTTIEKYAFYECTGLTGVTIGSNVTSMVIVCSMNVQI